MKSIKTILCVAAMAVATPTFAQFSNAGGKASGASASYDVVGSYNRLGVSYRLLTASPDEGDSMGFNGVAVDWIHGFSVSKTIPLYIETGIGLGYGYYSDSVEDIDISINDLDISVPVNLSYRWNLNENFSLQPYVGLNFKVNLLGELKLADEDEDYTASFFDKEDVGDDGTWNRFQMGWHVGVGANIKKLYVGLSFGTDFIELGEKLNTSTFKIGIGYNF